MTTASRIEDTASMQQLRISIESLAYGIIFLIALGLRWIELGAAPLSLPEARQAMAAWGMISTRQANISLIESPLIFITMLISFTIASPGAAAARFVPMLGGMGLVFSPLLFKKRLGSVPTLIAVITFLGGVQLMTMGIIGEYLGRMFNEVKNRPLYFLQDDVTLEHPPSKKP